MNTIPEFKSDLASSMRAYCEHSLHIHSYVVKNFPTLRQLDEHCHSIGHCSGVLDADLVTTFLEATEDRLQAGRVLVIRGLAYHMQQAGTYAYVIPLFSDKRKKAKTKTFESQFKERMEAFIHEKRSLGYKYLNEAHFLRYFDAFIVSRGYQETELTRSMVLDYSVRPGTESKKTRKNKLSIVRLFAQYLVRNGENAYVYDEVLGDSHPLPYVFDCSETKAFFQSLDVNKYRFHWGKYLYPVYFRLLYTTGMRESEACSIERADIDYKKRRFLIRDAKGQKDRYVYFSETACQMLKSFDAKFEMFFPGRLYLFIGTKCTADSCLSNATVRHAFRKCWAAAGLPYDRDNGISPCVHSFRHTYTIDKIAQWQQEGRNVDSLIPYLSTQLGHKSIQETYHYCMRIDSKFGEIMDSSKMPTSIVPEVSH